MGTSSMACVCLLALVLAVGSCQAKFDTPVDGIDKYGDKLKLLVSNLKTLANATGSNATGGSVSERIASLRNLVNVEGDVAKLQDTVDKLGHKLSDSWGTAQVAPELPYIEPEFNHTMEEQAVARVAVARDQMNVMQNKAHQEVADAMMASVAAEKKEQELEKENSKLRSELGHMEERMHEKELERSLAMGIMRKEVQQLRGLVGSLGKVNCGLTGCKNDPHRR